MFAVHRLKVEDGLQLQYTSNGWLEVGLDLQLQQTVLYCSRYESIITVYRSLTTPARFHTVPLDLAPIHQSKPQSQYSSMVGFCNTTGKSLRLSSCGSVSHADQCHNVGILSWYSMGSRRAASNLPAWHG